MPRGPKAGNLTDSLFAELQRRILSGALRPGDRLPPERELAERLGTNRNTLREAVRRLEQQRLVSARQGQGVTVLDFRRTATIELLAPFLAHGPDDAEKARVLRDLLPARRQVLEVAVSHAAERADEQDLGRLRRIAAAVARASDAGHVAAIGQGDLRFVDALVDAAHSIPIRWIANPFLDATRALLERFPALWGTGRDVAPHMAAVVERLDVRDGPGAAGVVRHHYARVDAEVAGLLDALGSLAAAASPAPPVAPVPPHAVPPPTPVPTTASVDGSPRP